MGPNIVFADDDQQRSRPGRLAKHPAFGLLLSPAGYLTPPIDFVTDGRKAGCFASCFRQPIIWPLRLILWQTDGRPDALPAGYLTPPVDFVTYFVTDRRTDGQTDRRTDELKVFWAFYSIFKNKKTKFGISSYIIYEKTPNLTFPEEIRIRE